MRHSSLASFLRPRPAVCALLATLALPVQAEIPPGQALALLDRNNPHYPELSPLLGFLALHSGVLANIRFCGGYASTPNSAYPPHPQVDPHGNCPQDPIAAVVEYLFPSPDGTILVCNELGKDPIGEIAREQRARRQGTGRAWGPGGLRKVMALLFAASDYRQKLAAPGFGSLALEADSSARQEARAAAGREFQAAAYRILAREPKPGNGLGAAKADGKDSAFERLRRQFSGLLQEAVLEDATGELKRYPPGIVEQALLAYAWQVADSAGELREAFDGGDLPGLCCRPEGKETLPVLDRQQYESLLPAFMERLTGPEQNRPAPEECAILMYGYACYGSQVMDLVTYRTTSYDSDPYPDCGETALRNFLNEIFGKEGELDPHRIEAFIAQFGHQEGKDEAPPVFPGRLQELRSYYEHFPTLGRHHSDRAHAEWSNLVSNLNHHPHDPLPILYRNKGTHNLRGAGQENMLNLIAHILPDPVLALPWPTEPGPRLQLAARKWSRLCALGSLEGRKLSWDVDGKEAIPGPFFTMRFRVDGRPAFLWAFMDGHFVIQPAIPSAGEAWPLAPDARPGAFLAQAMRRRLGLGRLAVATDRGRPYEVFCFNRGNPADALAVARFLTLTVDSKAMSPIVRQVLNSNFPLDRYALDLLGRFFWDGPGRADDRPRTLLPLEFLQELPLERKNALLGECLAGGYQYAIQLLLAHGADPDLKGEDGRPWVVRALGDESASTRQGGLDLLKAGADLKVRGPQGATVLHLAVAMPRGEDGFLRELLDLGADPFAVNDAGETPLQEAERLGKTEAAELLRQAMASRQQPVSDGKAVRP